MVPNLQAATPKHFFDLEQVIKYMFPHVTPLNLIRLNTICTSHSLFPPCIIQVFKWLINYIVSNFKLSPANFMHH